MDPIQVLGQKDFRKEVQVKDENTAGQLLVKNTLAGNVPEEKGGHVKNSKRYIRGMSNTSIRG